jgi:hypothetical protein
MVIHVWEYLFVVRPVIELQFGELCARFRRQDQEVLPPTGKADHARKSIFSQNQKYLFKIKVALALQSIFKPTND